MQMGVPGAEVARNLPLNNVPELRVKGQADYSGLGGLSPRGQRRTAVTRALDVPTVNFDSVIFKAFLISSHPEPISRQVGGGAVSGLGLIGWARSAMLSFETPLAGAEDIDIPQ